MTDTRTKAQLLVELEEVKAKEMATYIDLVEARQQINELKNDDGLFEGDLRIELHFNPAEQLYKVNVWEWSTDWDYDLKKRTPLAWYGMRDLDIPHERTYPAKRFEKALKWYGELIALRARNRARHVKAEEIAAGWQMLGYTR